MMGQYTTNPFEIFGFQEEKAHVGMVAWLLDCRNPHVDPESRASLLRSMLQVDIDPSMPIRTYREYGLEDRRSVDLVVGIGNDPAVYWVVEFKTDSDVKREQLKTYKKDFENKQQESKERKYAVFALGAGRFTLPPDGNRNLDGWTAFDCDDVRRSFGRLVLKGNAGVFAEWLKALEREGERHLNLPERYRQAAGQLDELYAKGYRRDFAVWYGLYDHLRQEMERPDEWAIYSGGHNPVLNWQPWFDGGPNYALWPYYEFNWGKLMVKVRLRTSGAATSWFRLKEKLEKELCSRVGGERTRTRHTVQGFASIWKMELDFVNHTIKDIAARTEAIIRETKAALEQAAE